MSSSEEKPRGKDEEKPRMEVGPVSNSPTQDLEVSAEQQKRIIRMIDLRVVLPTGILYCVSIMDRSNLGVANIAGLSKDLELIDNRYAIASLVFFISYTLFQPPSTVLVRSIGPRKHLTLIAFLWGAVMFCMGFVKDWKQLTALRFLLGILEAGYFPSCVYLMSTWYTRYELGRRLSAFFLISLTASAFAPLMAFGFAHMAGLQNMGGWAWIFIMSGLISMVLAVINYWFLVDFPDSNRATRSFLGTRERAWVCARVEADRGDSKLPPFSLLRYVRAGLDVHVWVFGFMIFCTTTVGYALAFFLPVILVQNMGFDTGTAQLLTAPPYAFAAAVTWAGGWFGDRYKLRGPLVVANMVLCLMGLPIMGFHSSPWVRYFGVFLVTAGINANAPAALTYQANNIRGQWKRAFCSATTVGSGGIGGIAGSLIFRTQDAPAYRPGLYACIACCVLIVSLVGLLSIRFWSLNRQADKGLRELEADDEDFQPGFRYTL